MDEKYFAKKIEGKWQSIWATSNAFEAGHDDGKPKFYALEMLPYPSGNLHMGHVRNYSIGDALAWFKRLKGFNVLHPIGWDSFGQPAEDAAIKRGVNPRDWTEENIAHMTGQLKRLGLSYDWSREMAAHRPDYYKFDQWFFLKMLEKGLAYKKKTQVNWCESCQATLSNEQASGGLCWRCQSGVTKKELDQWFFKTTAYADQLLDDMKEIEAGWAEKVLKRQRDWIGRSDGAYVEFSVAGDPTEKIKVFTTRIDTIYGVNAIVLAAEHPLVGKFWDSIPAESKSKIEDIRAEKLKVTDHEEEAEKDGVPTGLMAVNPFSGDEIPVWVGNYVMIEYGTGAVMSVPAHDERDFEFAKKFGLPIRQVISEPHLAHEHHTMHALALSEPMTEYGVLVHSDFWNGKSSDVARSEMTDYAVKNGFGEAAVTFRLRDWGVSRQRFWGAPIPIVYCDKCGTVPEKFENLPVRLPDSVQITGSGESPLAKVPEFVDTNCPSCDSPAKRETDTMDTFVDSSWYYFRYLDPKNDSEPFDPKVAEKWAPVDQYIGGDDHAVMHLIYTRFWSKVMRDLGLVKFNEPVKRLLTQGMVVGETFFEEIPNPDDPEGKGKRIYHGPSTVKVERNEKGKLTGAYSSDGKPLKWAVERMSKSKGNGVDPDEMVEIYGADASRIFVLFAAPAENELVWNESGIEGAVRFLQRLWRVVWKWESSIGGYEARFGQAPSEFSDSARTLRRKTHQAIGRVTDSLESLQFNTPVAAMMELINAIYDFDVDPDQASESDVFAFYEAVRSLTLMLTPFAPHTAEEVFSVLCGNENGILANGALFPVADAALAVEDQIEIPIQVNGKLRAKILVKPGASKEEMESLALADPKIIEHLGGASPKKVVVVPGRLVNVVC
jgi:leucyl-tRNA synthetase